MKFILLRKIFSIVFMFSFLATTLYAQNNPNFTLVVDAGHGGHDPGTMGNRKYKKHEKDVALSIALKFGKLVEKNMKDVKVVYTRKTDVFIKLIDRPKIANDNHADLFMSIHCNANNNSAINGSETYVLGTHKNKDNFNVAKKENSVIYLEKDYSVNYEGFDPNSISSIVGLTIGQEQYLENSLLLASLVQNNFKKHTALRSRGTNGVKQAGFWVLARNYMPSVLVETGFLSNDKDAKYLMSEKGQNQVANALYLGFKEYKKFWDEQSGMITDFENEEVVQEKVEETPKVVIAKKEDKKTQVNKTVVEVKKVKSKSHTKTQPKVKTKPKSDIVEAKSTVAMMVGSSSKNNTSVKKDVEKSSVRYEYAIQIMSSKKRISTESSSFRGLTKVTYYKDGSVYKYIYNRSPNYKEVLSSRKIVKTKGFKGYFVVAFKNGKRIALGKALKEDANN